MGLAGLIPKPKPDAQVSFPRCKSRRIISSNSEAAARLPAQAIAAWQQHRVVILFPKLAQLLRGYGLLVHGLDNDASEGAPNLLASEDLQLWWAVRTVFQLPAQRRVSKTL